MKKRWHEFQNELRDVGALKISFVNLTVWFQQWAAYITRGGVRPDRPH